MLRWCHISNQAPPWLHVEDAFLSVLRFMPPPDIFTITILWSQHSKKTSQDLDSVEKPVWAPGDSSFPCTPTLSLIPLVMIEPLQPERTAGLSLSGIFILRDYFHLLISWLVYSNCRELFPRYLQIRNFICGHFPGLPAIPPSRQFYFGMVYVERVEKWKELRLWPVPKSKYIIKVSEGICSPLSAGLVTMRSSLPSDLIISVFLSYVLLSVWEGAAFPSIDCFISGDILSVWGSQEGSP